MGAIVIRTRFDKGTESAGVATSGICVIDIASFFDLLFDFKTVPTVWYSLFVFYFDHI